MADFNPIHPGEILLKDFMEPMGLTRHKLAMALCVPASRIGRIVNGARAITVDTALRLSAFFGTTPEFWINAQMHYDLENAKAMELPQQIKREVRTCEELQICA